MIKELIDKLRQRKERFKVIQEDDRIGEIIAQRKKNSNERELERFYEEERQKQIAAQLSSFRKQRAEEGRKDTILSQKKIFANQRNIFVGNKDLFFNDKNMFLKRGNMFLN